MESNKKKSTTLVLCILGGWIGVHQYYVGKIFKGLIYTFTMGLFFIGWIVDIFKILTNNFYDSKRLLLKNDICITNTLPTASSNENTSENKKVISYHRKFNAAGVTFPCKLDESISRQEILECCYKGDTYYLQEYRYKSKPAFLIVCKKNGLDIGAVPADLVDKFLKYKDRNYELNCLEIGFFENERGKIIYYAKMQFIVYKD